MLVAMGHTVVGVLMGVGVVVFVGVVTVAHMIVMQVHKKHSFGIFLLLYPEKGIMSKHLFLGNIPGGGLRKEGKPYIIM